MTSWSWQTASLSLITDTIRALFCVGEYAKRSSSTSKWTSTAQRLILLHTAMLGGVTALAAQCPADVFPNCGMTDGAHIYNTTTAQDYSACCEICANDARNCTAWVFVADGPVHSTGPGTCKLRHTVSKCRPNETNHISGALHRQLPPAAGVKPHILLLVVDDWGWANVGMQPNP